MNDLTSAGADADGNPGLDAFTAQAPDGHDFVLKGSMQGTGTISSGDDSYYRLNGLNWELNQQWKTDPKKIVVSYKEDIDQGNIEARGILEKMMAGLTDTSMFQQGNVSHFLQAITTNMAVDTKKMRYLQQIRMISDTRSITREHLFPVSIRTRKVRI